MNSYLLRQLFLMWCFWRQHWRHFQYDLVSLWLQHLHQFERDLPVNQCHMCSFQIESRLSKNHHQEALFKWIFASIWSEENYRCTHEINCIRLRLWRYITPFITQNSNNLPCISQYFWCGGCTSLYQRHKPKIRNIRASGPRTTNCVSLVSTKQARI